MRCSLTEFYRAYVFKTNGRGYKGSNQVLPRDRTRPMFKPASMCPHMARGTSCTSHTAIHYLPLASHIPLAFSIAIWFACSK